jgi:hypothetical protein
MADAVQGFVFNLPGGGTAGHVGWFLDTPLGLCDVDQILIQFPPGTAGLCGVRIEYSVNPVYPIVNGQFFIADDFTFTIPVSNQGNSGQWRISGYNADTFVHNINVWYYYNWLTQSQQSGSSPLVSL